MRVPPGSCGFCGLVRVREKHRGFAGLVLLVTGRVGFEGLRGFWGSARGFRGLLRGYGGLLIYFTCSQSLSRRLLIVLCIKNG
jgi:hypothetical protein